MEAPQHERDVIYVAPWSICGAESIDGDDLPEISQRRGEVIREPWDSPFGRMCLLADSTGATITLTEVEDAPEEEPTESDDVLGLDPQ